MTDSVGERIAVFLANWVGDVVMATPVLRAARGRFPNARIVCVGRATAGEVVAGCPWHDETVVVPAGRPRLRNFLRAARRLRRERFDLALLLPNSFRIALLARAGACGRIVGYRRDGRGWLLSDFLDPPRDRTGRYEPLPTIDYYIRLAEHAGIPVTSRSMSLGVAEEDEARAAALLARAGDDPARPRVMLNPGASFGPSKMWDPERFAAVADALTERRGAQVILNAAPSVTERRIAARVVAAMTRKPLINLADLDNTIGLLKALLRRCDLLITNDTGPRHVAAALGTAVVTLFGSTDPVWARLDYERERIIRLDVPCSPCQKKLCPQPAGPFYHQCMAGITPEMVVAAAEELLGIPRKEGGPA